MTTESKTASETTTEATPRCRDCDAPIDPTVDDRGLCEECEGNYEWCEVCREYQGTDGSECRHIFYASWGEWVGAGSYSGGWNSCREEFWGLLDALAAVPPEKVDWLKAEDPGRDLVTAIEAEIAANTFWLRSGAFCLHFYKLRPDLPNLRPGDGLPFASVDEDSLDDDSEDQDEDGAIDDSDIDIGLGWLSSLEDAKTPAANARTVQWIQLWRANRRLTVLNGGPRSLDWFRLRAASLRLGAVAG